MKTKIKPVISVAPITTHYILVDYDNLAKNIVGCHNFGMKPEDCPRVISLVLKSLDEQSTFFRTARPLEKISVYLYNGWYRDVNKTRLAENILKEISYNPNYKTYTLSSALKVYIDIRLAYGLLSLQQKPFYGTLRRYGPNIKVYSQYSPCCDLSNQLIKGIKHYTKTGCCNGCGNDISKAFFSEGQKLVDTMLTCDMHWLAKTKENSVALVSSDDDLVPPIFQQALETSNVYHVLTTETSSHCFENFYLPLKPESCEVVYLKIGA